MIRRIVHGDIRGSLLEDGKEAGNVVGTDGERHALLTATHHRALGNRQVSSTRPRDLADLKLIMAILAGKVFGPEGIKQRGHLLSFPMD
jgi:hypothetical protein